MTGRPQPQTVLGADYGKVQLRAGFASLIGFGLALWPAVILTDGLPIEQRLVWIIGAVLAVVCIAGFIIQDSSAEPWSRRALLDAEHAIAMQVGEPAVIVAIYAAPDLEHKLAAAQDVSSLTVSPAALISAGPGGVAIGPSRPSRGVVQFVERRRVVDLRLGETQKYQTWPPIHVTVRSRRGVEVHLEVFATTRRPVNWWEARSLRLPQADEREVREMLAAMRATLNLPE